jgi:LysM repeat protein
MLSDRNKEMNIRDLLDKIDVLAEAGETPPASITPTHFHKSNIGTSLPLMMTSPGVFWWETSSNDSEGGQRGNGGRSVQRWQGDTENRSKWNPASVDGVFVNGKPVEFPEGVNWKTYKPEELVPGKKPEEQSTKPSIKPQADDGHTAKLNALSLQLQDKLNDKKKDVPMKHQMGAIFSDPDEYEKFPKVGEESYTIKPGDNLTRIARKFGTTIPEILKKFLPKK